MRASGVNRSFLPTTRRQFRLRSSVESGERRAHGPQWGRRAVFAVAPCRGLKVPLDLPCRYSTLGLSRLQRACTHQHSHTPETTHRRQGAVFRGIWRSQWACASIQRPERQDVGSSMRASGGCSQVTLRSHTVRDTQQPFPPHQAGGESGSVRR